MVKNLQKDVKTRNVLRVALYVRVSSQDQVENYSIGEQTERLQKYCEAMGWEIYKIYVDPGYSGGNMDRPGLKGMIRDIEDGMVDQVVVYKLDRLSRSQFDTLYLLEKVFIANDTDLVSMTENFSTSSSLGKAMIGFLAIFAQLEKDKINERMIMGKEARAKEGKWGGGAYVPIGYDYDQANDLLLVNEFEKMQILELFDLFLKGTPLRTIEKIFKEKGYKHKHGTWSTQTMRKVMRSRINLGYIKYNNNFYKGEHEPIIDEERHDKAVRMLDERLNNTLNQYTPGKTTTYLGGLLFCKRCGARYAKQRNHRKKGDVPLAYWYTCYSRSKKSKPMIKDPNCKNKNWKMIELDNLVFTEIKKLAMDPNYIHEIQKEKRKNDIEPNKVDIIKAQIKELDDQISRFMDLYGIGKFTIDQVSSKVDPLNEQKRALEREIENIVSSSDMITEEEAIELVNSFEDALDGGDFNEIRLIVESLIYFIEIDDEDIFIHWKFA